jgi:hypothetical protein
VITSSSYIFVGQTSQGLAAVADDEGSVTLRTPWFAALMLTTAAGLWS